MKLLVLDQKALVTKEMVAEPAIFGSTKSVRLVSQAVRVFLSNQRKARAKTKTRAKVVGSGAKIWKQKGTGRARHSSRKAPLFVGGGVSHGPTGKQNYHLKINKKMAKKAVAQILTDKLKDKQLYLVKDLVFKKTKEALEFVNKVRESFKIKEGIGFVITPGEDIERYLRNLDEVLILKTGSLNPYQLLLKQTILITQKAYEEIRKHYLAGEKKVKKGDLG